MLTNTFSFKIEQKTLLNDISLISPQFASSAPNLRKMDSITSEKVQESEESSLTNFACKVDSIASEEPQSDESSLANFASMIYSITPDELQKSDESSLANFASTIHSITSEELQKFDESNVEPSAGQMDFSLSKGPEKNNFEYFIPGDSRFRTCFACMSLHGVDRIRFLQLPQENIFDLRTVIQSSWYLGIQAVQTHSLSHEFKLNGSPWKGQGSDAIPSRIVMGSILAYLYSVGWILQASTNVTKVEYDKDTLIFRKQEMPPPETDWIAISFNQSNRLRLIGANTQLICAFRTMLKGTKLFRGEGWKDKSRKTWEFKIQGAPWIASGEEKVVVKLLLLKLVETLERHGWSLYASVDQNAASVGPSGKTDSWFCNRKKGWDI
jgi:hypothetical protein